MITPHHHFLNMILSGKVSKQKLKQCDYMKTVQLRKV